MTGAGRAPEGGFAPAGALASRCALAFRGAFASRSGLALAVALALSLAPLTTPARAADGRAVVGSKNFSESRLLAEMFAQLLEARTNLEVQRRLGLAGTAVCFGALTNGDIDLYPEYTGTGLVTLLGRSPTGTPAEVLATVRRDFAARYDAAWLAPLGFENAYEVAVRRDVAERFGLATIGDLAEVAGELTAGFGYEFTQREDGLIGLRRVYGLSPGRLLNMQQALKYEAAGQGELDMLDVYTTDGRILVYDLVVLEDDRGVFPPYQACPLVRGAALREHPEIAAVLGELSGLLDEGAMRGLNKRVEVDGVPEAEVAHAALLELGLIGPEAEAPAARTGRGVGLWEYMWKERARLLRRTLEHLGLVGAAMSLSILVAVPLGLWLLRKPRWAEPVIRATGLLQTLPSIALLAFMIPLLGVGAKPAVAALFLYGLFPILRNTYTGVRDADPSAVDSAEALGMSDAQVLRHVRLPLAGPVILAGIRVAAVISVGTATLAAFIGAGGLGQPIVAGLQLNDTTVVLSGALPAALLALLVDGLLAAFERWARPAGVW